MGPQSDGQVSMSSITTRMGNTTIEIDGISKSYGNHTFIRDFSYIFLKNDRVGFVWNQWMWQDNVDENAGWQRRTGQRNHQSGADH